jgi:hypothetical protein
MGSSPIALTKTRYKSIASGMAQVIVFGQLSVSTPCQQIEQPMPRDGAIIFSDLIGKLDVLRVTCSKCERAGRYPLDRLIETRGRDAKIVESAR